MGVHKLMRKPKQPDDIDWEMVGLLLVCDVVVAGIAAMAVVDYAATGIWIDGALFVSLTAALSFAIPALAPPAAVVVYRAGVRVWPHIERFRHKRLVLLAVFAYETYSEVIWERYARD